VLGAHGGRPREQPIDDRRRRELGPRVEVDEPPVEPVADRAPEVLLDRAPGRIGERDVLVLVARGLGDAGDHEGGERLGLGRRRLRVADPHLDGPERQVRAHRPPDLRVLDDRARRDEELEVLAVGLPAAVGVRDPAAREALGERLRAPGVQAGVEPVDERRVRADGEQQREHRPQPVAHAHRAVESAQADVDVQRPRVVAPGDVLQALDDAAVVLGVDVVLGSVVGPGVGSGRPKREPAALGEREESGAHLALAAQRVAEVLAAPGADLDLARDQLAGDRGGEHGVLAARSVPELLEALDEVQGRGVEEHELLLEPHGQIRGPVEAGHGAAEVERHVR
jgi:hypothetical protein